MAMTDNAGKQDESCVSHKMEASKRSPVITLYKGVSQSDIAKRTPRFLAYAGILIEREKRKF